MRAANGEGSMHNAGYWRFHLPGHPLADARGDVLRGRAVLYDKLVGQDAPCHWCHVPLRWRTTLTADHLDHDRLNDDPANLVPSCLPCNSARPRARGRKLTLDAVAAIRMRVAAGETQVALARSFGVSDVMVNRIVRGTAWKV